MKSSKKKGIDNSMEKMTYVSALDVVLASGSFDADVMDTLTRLKDSIAKRNSAPRGMTKGQRANEDLKTAILDNLVIGKTYTISEVTASVPDLNGMSCQKVTSLVGQMVKAGSLHRDEIKRVAYFSLPEA